MGWSGGSYSKGNVGTGGWAGDASLGIGIEAGRHDTQDNDFATGINQCVNKDGSNAFTGNPNLGGFIPTNLGAGTAAAPALCAGNDVNTGIYSPNADNIGIATNGVERVRLDSAGLLGIGTTSPQTKLHVTGTTSSATSGATNKGTVQIDESGISALTQNGGLEFKGSTTGSGYGSRIIGFDDASLVIARRQSSATWTESMRIDPIGRVGIGTSPSYQLHVSTDSAAKPTTNTWTISSDARIKTNIQPYTKGLAEICQVAPVTYDYNGKGGIAAGPGGVSILAQELQTIFPECVGSYRGKLEEADEEETDILNYNGHAITFALINAIKQLNTKVESLEAQIEMLQTQVAIG
jgi:hypothetical protein